MSAKDYKQFKDLKKENLRDNMSTTELILNMLAETATKDISKSAECSYVILSFMHISLEYRIHCTNKYYRVYANERLSSILPKTD